MRHKNILIYILVSLLVFPGVFGAGNGEISQIDQETLFMDYDQEVRELNHTITLWSDGVPFNFYETDTRFSVEFSVLNRNFFELFLRDSPNGEREYSFLYCTEHEIPDYDRYAYHGETRCPDNFFKYKLRDVRENRRINIKIPPVINGTGAFWWFIGGDPRGYNAAGGGGGLPVCSGLQAAVSQNQSTTYVGNKFKMGGLGSFISYEAGCSAVSLTWETQRPTTYSIIPTGYSSNSMLSGDGVTMSQNPVSFNVWYYKYPLCEYAATRNIRIKFQGYYNSRLQTVYSSPLTHTCEDPPVPPEINLTWENPTPENFSTQTEKDLTLNLSTNYSERTSSFIDFNGDLLSYLRFDNYNTTHIKDNSTHENPGEFKSGMSDSNIIEGIFGEAVNFTDENDYISLGTNNFYSPQDESMTWIFWINPRDWNPSSYTDDYLYSSYQSSSERYYFRMRQADYFQFYGVVGGTAYNFQDTSVNPYPLNNEWSNLIVMFNRSSNKFIIYVNGVLAGETNAVISQGVNFSNTGEKRIASYYASASAGTGTLHGSIDEFKIYNRLLSTQEILAINDSLNNNVLIEKTDLDYNTYEYCGFGISTDGLIKKSCRNVTIELIEDDGLIIPIHNKKKDKPVYFLPFAFIIISGSLILFKARKEENP